MNSDPCECGHAERSHGESLGCIPPSGFCQCLTYRPKVVDMTGMSRAERPKGEVDDADDGDR